MQFDTHTQGYEYLKKQGIHVIDDYRVCKTADEVWEAITAIGENRGNLGYDIDGAVVKINRFSDRGKARDDLESAQMGDRLQISAGGKKRQSFWISSCRSEGQAGSRRLRYLSRYGSAERAFRGRRFTIRTLSMIWMSESGTPLSSTNPARSFRR